MLAGLRVLILFSDTCARSADSIVRSPVRPSVRLCVRLFTGTRKSRLVFPAQARRPPAGHVRSTGRGDPTDHTAVRRRFRRDPEYLRLAECNYRCVHGDRAILTERDGLVALGGRFNGQQRAVQRPGVGPRSENGKIIEISRRRLLVYVQLTRARVLAEL